MMALEGKGFFTWKIPNCEHGDPKLIADYARDAGLTHVVLKIADGTMIYNGTWGDPKDYTTPVVNALRNLGIKVWGWHYIYGDYPTGEANVAIARIRQYNLDGYVIDVEKEYKASGKKAAAKRFMAQVRAACPNLTIALSSYRYPSLHPQIPWAEFLESCDLNMPQVYWMKAHNPGDQLARCVKEFQARRPSLPIVPTGAAFREYGWKPADTEVLEFLRKAKELNLKAANFWEWSDARSGNIPGVWEVIKKYNWAEQVSARDICEVYIDTLNTHDVNKVLDLYTLPAVHINSQRSTQGFDDLRAWYSQLFNVMLPNGKFSLGTFSGKGSSRHLTWTASSARGNILDGNDTLGLSHGKINYHYSFFSVDRRQAI
ncbi:MAG: nuclear transport factor 2 family protein [Acidobacteriaceae bacterium]